MDQLEMKPQGEKNEMHKKQKALWLICLVLCLCCALLFVLWQVSLWKFRRASKYFDIDRLNEMLAMFDGLSVYDTPTREALTDALLYAVAGSFDDQYAEYYTQAELDEWISDLSGDFVGIGVAILWQAGLGYEVLDVFDDSPAQKAGILVGDILCAVDGQSAATVGAEATLNAIAGEAGTSVEVSVLREGQTLTLSCIRAKVVSRSVLYKTMEQGGELLGYVRITSFDGSGVSGNTFTQFKEAIDTLTVQGVSGFVLDLRNNGGGTVFAAAQMLAYLLPDGVIGHMDYGSELIEDYTISAEGDKMQYANTAYTLPEGQHEVNVPIVLLVNERTASASELFTSTLRDYGQSGQMNVTLIGKHTYGKGSVQTTYGLSSGGGYKLTVAKLSSAFGVEYDGKGIAPDIAIELPDTVKNTNLYKLAYEDDTQLQAAVQHLLSN